MGKFTDLNRKIATICTVSVIGLISTAVFGLAGGISLTLASAFITTKLLAILKYKQSKPITEVNRKEGG